MTLSVTHYLNIGVRKRSKYSPPSAYVISSTTKPSEQANCLVSVKVTVNLPDTVLDKPQASVEFEIPIDSLRPRPVVHVTIGGEVVDAAHP